MHCPECGSTNWRCTVCDSGIGAEDEPAHQDCAEAVAKFEQVEAERDRLRADIIDLGRVHLDVIDSIKAERNHTVEVMQAERDKLRAALVHLDKLFVSPTRMEWGRWRLTLRDFDIDLEAL